MASIETTWLENSSTQGKSLELLSCVPESPTKPAILFIHGAFCSAHDYQLFLPYFASQGFPAYALSLRAHGQSWSPSWLNVYFVLSLDDHVSDMKVAIEHVRTKHGSPFITGHSLGGGYLQYLLAQEGKLKNALVRGLILLGSAPLSGGGKQIMANWEQVETNGKGYDYPWSPRSQLETLEQVKAAFFHPDTPDEPVQKWMDTCRTKTEGIRTGLSVFWPFGEAADVLSAIEGGGQKVLCVSADLDRLVLYEMVEKNVAVYREVAPDAVQEVVVKGSGHHMMMDTAWEACAAAIVDWAT